MWTRRSTDYLINLTLLLSLSLSLFAVTLPNFLPTYIITGYVTDFQQIRDLRKKDAV